MLNESRILAMIPARAGSKGLPGKNIKKMLGKPLIGWTIEEAKKSRYIDRIIVSTDSTEIAECAEKFDAEVPFLRPTHLAADSSSSIDTVIHAVDWLRGNNEDYDIIVLLEPTSPLRDSEDIDNALEVLQSNEKARSIVSVSKIKSAHPAFLVINSDGFMKPYDKDAFSVKRRQDITECFFFDGSFYISTVESLIEKKSFYHTECLIYEVPEWKSFEIDTIEDFHLISIIMKAREEGFRF